MFRVDARFEIPFPAVLQATDPGARQYRITEHCLNVPLWYVEVLPISSLDDDCPLWRRYLITRAVDVLGVVLNGQWQNTYLHVLLPRYMTGRTSPVLAQCSAMWECRAIDDATHPTWLFETDAGAYVDPSYGLDMEDVERLSLRWQAAGPAVSSDRPM